MDNLSLNNNLFGRKSVGCCSRNTVQCCCLSVNNTIDRYYTSVMQKFKSQKKGRPSVFDSKKIHEFIQFLSRKVSSVSDVTVNNRRAESVFADATLSFLSGKQKESHVAVAT